MKNFIPFAVPLIDDDEVDEVVDTLRSGWLTTGPKCARFEEDFKRFVGAQHCLAVNSATSGLHLALEAIGIVPGDTVITTPYTFTATAEVIRYLGADPVFVDIDPYTFNMDLEKLGQVASANPRARAIVPVHIAGQACDMQGIARVAKEFSLKVVEDAAHALPTTFDGELIGNFSDITVYSFYATKTLATGEGGMIVTNNSDYHERMKIMRLHGISKDVFNRYTSKEPSWYYEVIAPGFKYNMTDIAASIGIHQLKKLWDFQKRRAEIAEMYSAAFKNLPIRTPDIAKPEDVHSWHLYMLQLDLESLLIDRDRFIELMAEEGVGTSVHFIPLHLQPYWRDRYDFQPGDFPNAYSAFKREISLPIYPKMTDDDVMRTIEAVTKIVKSNLR